MSTFICDFCDKPTPPAERPTPITDAVWRKHTGFSPQSAADAYELAGNLERQLAEAHEEIARLNKSLSNASAIYDAACEQRDRLAEALPVAMARAYASGYQHGHEDTVETQFIPVHHTDTKDYFADNIRQMMIDGSQPEATEALVAVKGGPQ